MTYRIKTVFNEKWMSIGCKLNLQTNSLTKNGPCIFAIKNGKILNAFYLRSSFKYTPKFSKDLTLLVPGL